MQGSSFLIHPNYFFRTVRVRFRVVFRARFRVRVRVRVRVTVSFRPDFIIQK